MLKLAAGLLKSSEQRMCVKISTSHYTKHMKSTPYGNRFLFLIFQKTIPLQVKSDFIKTRTFKKIIS